MKVSTAVGLGTAICALIVFMSGCKSDSAKSSGGGSNAGCSLTDNTSATATVNAYGCAVLARDTSSCQAARVAQGLTGFWLHFSCRIQLTKSGPSVILAFDGRPDNKSQYFGSSHACYESFSAAGRFTNPNIVAAQSITMTVPFNPATNGPNNTAMGTIGAAINGASIFSNQAAPGDSIYAEVASFDKCEGHPENRGSYHLHIEAPSITSNDYAFIGVLRDGFPVYGRKDMDGNVPVLDAQGGHVGETPDSGGANVYHYHVHHQTDGVDSAYFISSGAYKGTAGPCSGC